MAKQKGPPPKERKKPPKSKPPANPPPKKKAAAKKPTKPKEERFDTPEALAKFDAAYFRRGVELYDAMKAAQAENFRDKQKEKDSRKLYEAARIEHEEHTAAGKKWRGQKPPGQQMTFDDLLKPEASAPATPPAASPTATAFKPDAPHADLWRKFPLDRWTWYGCLPSDLKKLSEGKIKGTNKAHPILTVGDLSDFCQPWPNDPSRNYGFADIVGLGEAGATRISDAQIRFFNEWNTKGLREEFAKEKGYNLDEGKPGVVGGSAGDGAGKGNGKGKPGSAGSGGKPKPKKKRKPPALNTSTPTINPSGIDPAGPFDGGDDAATVPFEQPKPGASEPATAAV